MDNNVFFLNIEYDGYKHVKVIYLKSIGNWKKTLKNTCFDTTY